MISIILIIAIITTISISGASIVAGIIDKNRIPHYPR